MGAVDRPLDINLNVYIAAWYSCGLMSHRATENASKGETATASGHKVARHDFWTSLFAAISDHVVCHAPLSHVYI